MRNPDFFNSLLGDEKELRLRLILTYREEYTVDKLEEMSELLKKVYSGNGVYPINTKNKSLLEVAQEIARIIHLEELEEDVKMHDELEKIRDANSK